MNPYRNTPAPPPVDRRRGQFDWLFFVGAMLALVKATLLLVPGLFLANQRWEWFPLETGLTGIEFNGNVVGPISAMWFLLGFGFAVSGIGLALLWIGIRRLGSNTPATRVVLTGIAGSEMISRPTVADWDDQARLVVFESAGVHTSDQVQLQSQPHRLVRLVDTDDDVAGQRSRFDS